MFKMDQNTFATAWSKSASSVTQQITTLLNSYVGDKEAELKAIKMERDAERKKNDELTLEIQALQKKSDDIAKKGKLAISAIEDNLKKLMKENEVMGKEKEEMERKVKRLEEELKEEKRMKQQIIDEYTQVYGRNSVMMQLVRERLGKMNKTIKDGQGIKMRKIVEVIQLEDEDN